MSKKIKVRLLPKVHSTTIGDKRYVPGDVFEIPTRLFHPEFMEKVEPAPKKQPVAVKEPEEPTPPEELKEEEATAEEKKK